MVPVRNYYHPIDAAILWSGLAPYEAQITKIGLYSPEKLRHLFPQWPFLHAYIERIYDAISCNELPAMYLGHPISPNTCVESAYLTIRHSDLRIWFARYYPDEKPSFLFKNSNDHSQCITIGTYLAQKADFETCKTELEKIRHDYASLTANLMHTRDDRASLIARSSEHNTPTDSSTITFITIIGALLEVTIGNSKDRKPQSIYKNQTAIVNAILEQFPNTPGLSKRTLDRKFAAARRHLKQTR